MRTYEKVREIHFIYIDNQTKKQVRFKEILDSIDKLSVIDENYEELDAYSDQDGLTKAVKIKYLIYKGNIS